MQIKVDKYSMQEAAFKDDIMIWNSSIKKSLNLLGLLGREYGAILYR